MRDKGHLRYGAPPPLRLFPPAVEPFTGFFGAGFFAARGCALAFFGGSVGFSRLDLAGLPRRRTYSKPSLFEPVDVLLDDHRHRAARLEAPEQHSSGEAAPS